MKASVRSAVTGIVGRPTLSLLLLVVACSDPGSGGTGAPASGSAPPTAMPSPAPAPAAPTAPPPSAETPPSGDGGCPASTPAGTDAFTGEVAARAGDCLVVADRAIRVTGAVVARRSGAAATLDDLVPGIRVTIEPEPADPTRARAVTIEDVAP